MRVIAREIHAGNMELMKNVFKRAAAFFHGCRGAKIVKAFFRNDIGRSPDPSKNKQIRIGLESSRMLRSGVAQSSHDH